MIDRADRIMGAIMGAFTSDALALGSHWHYDLAKRDDELYPGGIQGFDRPVTGHYHEGREPGDFTHYGDAGMVLLLSLNRHQGINLNAYADEFTNYFRLYAGYIDKATKAALDNADAGQPAPVFGGADDQTGGLTRNGLVALLASPDELAQQMEQVCAITQNNDQAKDAHRFHGHLLHALLQGLPLPEAVALAADQTESTFVQQALDQANGALDQPTIDATGEFGRACRLTSSLPATLQAVLRHGHEPQTCLMEIVRAGGDNAARAMVAGTWLGAAHGLGGIPTAWSTKVGQQGEILVLADRLAALAA